MSKGGKPEGLKFVKPSAEELDAARKILAGSDQKKQRSMQNSMAAFLKTNPTPDNNDISTMRGSARAEYLVKYLVFQNRKKTGTTNASESREHEEATLVDHHMWSKFQLIKAIGKKKAVGWLKSGKLTPYPDRITGSMDENCCEYKIPFAWTRSADRDKNSLTVSGESATTEDDLKNLVSMSIENQPDGGEPMKQPSNVKVKIEHEPSAAELQHRQEQADTDAFLKAPHELCRDLQQLSLATNQMVVPAKEKQYGTEFAEDLLSHQKKLKSNISAIEKIVLGATPARSEIPRLLRGIEKLKTKHDELLSFADKLGISCEGGPRKKRKINK